MTSAAAQSASRSGYGGGGKTIRKLNAYDVHEAAEDEPPAASLEDVRARINAHRYAGAAEMAADVRAILAAAAQSEQKDVGVRSLALALEAKLERLLEGVQ